MFVIVRHGFLFAHAHQHRQRVAFYRTEADSALHLVDTALLLVGTVIMSGPLLEQPAAADVHADAGILGTGTGAHDAVLAYQRHHAGLAQIEVFVKAGEVKRIDRHHHHAAKAAVRLVDTPGEL